LNSVLVSVHEKRNANPVTFLIAHSVIAW
jgi:hypothetical protein